MKSIDLDVLGCRAIVMFSVSMQYFSSTDKIKTRREGLQVDLKMELQMFMLISSLKFSSKVLSFQAENSYVEIRFLTTLPTLQHFAKFMQVPHLSP